MRYYSTLRPVSIGTFPKPSGNAILDIVNFDDRTPCDEINGQYAWGYIEYEKPLSGADAKAYDLVKKS